MAWKMEGRIRDMNGPPESNIKPLCDVLNAVPGVRTHASCQGHIYPCNAPYVMFYGPLEVAAALEKRLREDAHSTRPALSTLWTVEGMFDGAYRMAFSLKPPRYARFPWLIYGGIMGLQADLALLPEMAQEALVLKGE